MLLLEGGGDSLDGAGGFLTPQRREILTARVVKATVEEAQRHGLPPLGSLIGSLGLKALPGKVHCSGSAVVDCMASGRASDGAQTVALVLLDDRNSFSTGGLGPRRPAGWVVASERAIRGRGGVLALADREELERSRDTEGKLEVLRRALAAAGVQLGPSRADGGAKHGPQRPRPPPPAGGLGPRGPAGNKRPRSPDF